MASNSTNETTIFQGSRMVMGDRYNFTSATPLATTSATLSTTWLCTFVGYAPCTVSHAVIKYNLRTAFTYSSAPTGTFSELALYTGDFVGGKTAQLERIGSVNILPSINAQAGATVGIKRAIVPISAYTPSGLLVTQVSIGTPIWVVWAYYAGTGGTGIVAPVLNGGSADMGSGRNQQNSAALVLAPSSTTGYRIFTTQQAQSTASPAFTITYYSSMVVAP